MTTPIILAELYAWVLIFIGITSFQKNLETLFKEMSQSMSLMWISGLITFVIGFFTLAIYSVWSPSWYVIVTIAGWFTLLKGVAMMVVPHHLMKLSHKIHGKYLKNVGTISFVVGILLLVLVVFVR